MSLIVVIAKENDATLNTKRKKILPRYSYKTMSSLLIQEAKHCNVIPSMQKTLMAAKFFIPVFIILNHFCTANSQSPQANKITRGSILYTNSTPNFWPSPTGHFAFGFYPDNNGFRVGIWLIGKPQNTVVWTARRNDSVAFPEASLLFSFDGRLLLRSTAGEVELMAQTGQSEHLADFAAMLDSGNFVLYNSSLHVVWASFDHPTNTILVGQELAPDDSLYSSKSQTDDSVGDFRLLMEFNTNLRAFRASATLEDPYVYWSSSTPGGGSNVSLTLAADSRLYLKNATGIGMKNLTEGGLPVNKTALYRATFDVDGILRLYQHQIGENGSQSSNFLWEAIKGEDRCGVKGICGLNSYCTGTGQSIACLCPPMFDYLDLNDHKKGCKLNFSTESDCSANSTTQNYSMFTLERTGWERNEYDVLSSVSQEECSQACLDDCYCVVAMLQNDTCFKQKLPLRFGWSKTIGNSTSFVKIRFDQDTGSWPKQPSATKKLGKQLLIAGVVLIAFSAVVFLSSCYLIYSHKIWRYNSVSSQACLPDLIEEINLRSFSYEQLVAATNNFQQEIGRGASGRVFKGSLADYNGAKGKEIAVKRLEKMVEDGEREFRNEMKIIGRTHHKNLVHLLGFCSEGSNRLLVYEYMKNGSLGNLLFKSRERPSWKSRTKILQEIAKGLHYLHEECETKIIHCDIKPHNVLMNESWSAKISDFGLSKLLKPEQTRTFTVPRGTRGYEAPEWHKNNTPITTKADVYSFGILLLEILCCRKSMDFSAPDEEMILMHWVCKCYEAGELGKVVGNEAEVDLQELEKMVKVGLLCVQVDPDLRPTMEEVILMIDGNRVTPSPPSKIPSANLDSC